MRSRIQTAAFSLAGRPVRRGVDSSANHPAILFSMAAGLCQRVGDRIGQAAFAGRWRDFSSRAATWLLLTVIRFYQAVFAPVMPLGCKFYPSCSHYAAEAIARHGAARGGWLAARRLWRCRPFTPGGFDPVPDVAADITEIPGDEARSGARGEVRS